jgi:Uma2 family endonuclease
MPEESPPAAGKIDYEKTAQEYLRRLTMEHFMEATPQAMQRKITLESLDLVHARRPDIQVFNELLVQYPQDGRRKPGQVVPDNMVVVHSEPIQALGSFDLALQPARPFWVLEYVSRSSKRKDYDDNLDKYERDLAVPYYLIFAPEEQELTLYRHTGEKYLSVKPNEHGRLPLSELEMEVALLDGWVRFWFRGELLPLPADLLRELEETRRSLRQTEERLEQTEERLEQTEERLEQSQEQLQEAQQLLASERQTRESVEAELARLRAELERLRGSRPGTG